jgi:hypothetical protein
MEDCKPVITPMQTSCKLSKDDDSKSTDQRQYRSMIGNLLYVTTSRPDVMLDVRWQHANPKKEGYSKLFNDASRSKGGKGRKGEKCSYFHKGFHLESTYMQKQIDQMAQILQQKNL